MTTQCEGLCEGTHWILADPGMGACICQPAVFVEAEAMLEGHFDYDQDGSMFIHALKAICAERRDALADRSKLLEACGYTKECEVDQPLLNSLGDPEELRSDIQAVLADYLVSLGYSAPPVARLADDRLQNLCEAVWP